MNEAVEEKEMREFARSTAHDLPYEQWVKFIWYGRSYLLEHQVILLDLLIDRCGKDVPSIISAMNELGLHIEIVS